MQFKGFGKELGVCSPRSDQADARIISDLPDPVEGTGSGLVATLVLEGHDVHTGGSKTPSSSNLSMSLSMRLLLQI